MPKTDPWTEVGGDALSCSTAVLTVTEIGFNTLFLLRYTTLMAKTTIEAWG